MGTTLKLHLLLGAVVIVLVAMSASPALCVENTIFGIGLGDTPMDLLQSRILGRPDAMFASGNAFSFVRARGTTLPPWAKAVQMANIGNDQTEWIYNRDPAAIGVLITGTGINARVTDIVVSAWRNFKPYKGAETSKEISIGDTFAQVLKTYGWPNKMTFIAETGARAVTPPIGRGGPVAAPAGAAAEGMGSFAERQRALAGEDAPDVPPPPPPSTLAPTPVPMGGLGPLPSVGTAAPGTPAPVSPANTTIAPAGPAGAVTFTKSCTMSYPSVDFVVYRMSVFRIHIYGK